jgi:O-antigen/teichoic acid export membrane protein
MFWNFVLNAQLIATSFDRAILYGASIALALNVCLNLLLIPRFGYFACAVATLFTECALLTANLRFVSKVSATAWPDALGRLAITTALIAGFCFAWTRPSPGYAFIGAFLLIVGLLSVPVSWEDFSNYGWANRSPQTLKR